MINLKAPDYFTQRNNKIKPMSACMPTSRVMFYRGNCIDYKNDSDLPDDDYFMWLLNTDEAKEYCHKKYPWSRGKYPPNEVHGMYSTYLDTVVCGEKISDFRTELTYRDYIERIESGEVIMTSGAFPGLTGHAVVFIGLDKGGLYIADPWGDFRNGYKKYNKGDGYKVQMSYHEWLGMIKPIGEDKKWGHIIL